MYRTKLLIAFMIMLLASSNLFAQASTISGAVVDKATGEPLPGANVFLQGTSLGAASNVEGKYTIPRVSAGNYLLIEIGRAHV